jgi:hypothetical protein
MTIKLIFNITLTILIIYIFFIYSVENVENTTGQTNTSFTDQQKIDIKNIINELYMTDVDAIRNLSDVATKLQTQNKLILPGQLNVQGKLATNNLDPLNMPTGWTGGIRFIDGYSSGNMGFGPDGTTINAQINKDGNINGKKLTFIDGNVSGNMGFGPNATTINAQIDKNGNITGNTLTSNNGSISIVSNTIDTPGLNFVNTLKMGDGESSTWVISNMKSNSTNKNDNKLSFLRSLGFMKGNTPSLELYDSGDVNIPGNLTVNNIITKKNRARFIRVGNMKSTDIFTEAELKNNLANTVVITSNNTVVITSNNTDIDAIKPNNNSGATTNSTSTITIPLSNLEIAAFKMDEAQTSYDQAVAKFAMTSTKYASALIKAKLSTATNSSLVQDNWTLIEIRVFDDTGKNIASEGNVTIVKGTKDNISGNNIINNQIFKDPKNPSDNIDLGYRGSTGPQQLEIDLKGEYNISQIQLFNRQKLSETIKMNDTIVELITGNKDKPETLIINRRINTGLWDGIYYKEYML